ncbi:MAG: AbrB/MazE/SpoVT family DNA-binding domain-containing protein [Candidatus Asgardarchaeum californiense]|nr:MAG: AbrB/MazE/SpoVT family DNA-binding domain-containing protein [Candidatus Asgardarchaeum californiense]
MRNIVKVTRRGQTTIPTNIRKKLNIKEGDYLLVETDGNRIIFTPILNLEQLSGFLADKADVEAVKKEIEELRREY